MTYKYTFIASISFNSKVRNTGINKQEKNAATNNLEKN